MPTNTLQALFHVTYAVLRVVCDDRYLVKQRVGTVTEAAGARAVAADHSPTPRGNIATPPDRVTNRPPPMLAEM